MSRNNKGYETKHRIIVAAKELFYEQGLENTKIKDICRLADIRTGNFKYYFNQKYDIANEIFSELLMEAYVYTAQYTKDRSLNSLEANFRATMVYYRVIFSDPKNILYYYETINNESIYKYMNLSVRRIYQQFIKEFSLDISGEELVFIARADLGIRREFAIDYIDEKPDYDILYLVTKILTLLCRLFKIDAALADQYIEESLAFVEEHDFSHLRLLI